MGRKYRTLFLSVLVAFFLWFYVKSAAVSRLVVQVPVTFQNIQEGYVLVSEVPAVVPVEFEADGKSLLGLKYLWDVRYTVDLSSYKDGDPMILADHPDYVKYPDKSTVHVVSIPFRDTLRIYSELRVTRKVPVFADVDVTCEPGFVVVRGIRTTPDSLNVTGPQSLVQSIPYLRTEARTLKDVASDQELKLGILQPDSKRLSVEAGPVDVRLDVQPLGERTLENIPVRLLNLPPQILAVVQPSTFSIRIRGGVDLLSTITRDSVIGTIDYAEEQRLNRVEASPSIRVPADVEWNQLIPSRFRIVPVEPVP